VDRLTNGLYSGPQARRSGMAMSGPLRNISLVSPCRGFRASAEALMLYAEGRAKPRWCRSVVPLYSVRNS
jgi:hypothetical protein